MCWSQSTSGWFALIGALMSADQFRRFYKLYSTNQVGSTRMFSQFLLYFTYTLMELLQHIQYRVGLENMEGTEGRCVQSLLESPNVFFSFVAHFLVWLQPVVHNYWILHNSKKGKLAFKLSLTLAWITLIVATISLVMGYNNMFGFGKPEVAQNHTPVDPAIIFGVHVHNVDSKLCSYQGPNHLFWMFPYHPMWNYSSANWFVWLAVTIIPHFFRRSIGFRDFLGNNIVVGCGVFSGWIASVVVTLTVGNGYQHEIPSYWCLISMPFLILPYLVALIFKPKRFNFDETLYLKNKKVD